MYIFYNQCFIVVRGSKDKIVLSNLLHTRLFAPLYAYMLRLVVLPTGEAISCLGFSIFSRVVLHFFQCTYLHHQQH